MKEFIGYVLIGASLSILGPAISKGEGLWWYILGGGLLVFGLNSIIDARIDGVRNKMEMRIDEVERNIEKSKTRHSNWE